MLMVMLISKIPLKLKFTNNIAPKFADVGKGKLILSSKTSEQLKK
jgi:hypothetical protein